MMYRFVTVVSLLATGALANMMDASTTSSTAMMDEATSTTMMVESVAIMTETATSTAMMDETTSTMMMESSTPCSSSMVMAETVSAVMAEVSVAATGTAMTHTVIVGGAAGLVYTPSSVVAAVGDIILFQFMKQNHTVTQSTFAKPCVKLAGGLDSGFMPNPNNTIVPAPTFQFTVNSTDPTWWYCKQKTGTHCGKGMTFAVNPTMAKSYATFMYEAIAQNGTAASAVASAAVSVTQGSTVTLIGGVSTSLATASTVAEATQTVAAAAVSGFSGSGDSCSCSCFCGVAAFPQGVGINNIGGMAGALPAPWASSESVVSVATYSAVSSTAVATAAYSVVTDASSTTDTSTPITTDAVAVSSDEAIATAAADTSVATTTAGSYSY